MIIFSAFIFIINYYYIYNINLITNLKDIWKSNIYLIMISFLNNTFNHKIINYNKWYYYIQCSFFIIYIYLIIYISLSIKAIISFNNFISFEDVFSIFFSK